MLIEEIMLRRTIASVFVSAGLVFLWGIGTSLAYQPGPKLTFTFDGGSKSIYEQAVPILAGSKIPAVFYGETGPLNSGEDWVMT